MIRDRVFRLCEGIEGSNPKIFLDNLFPWFPTMTTFINSGINVEGTVQVNRIKEANKKVINGKVLQKKGLGFCSVTTSSNNITVLRWLDNNIVHIISSSVGQLSQDNVRSWNRKNKSYEELSRPPAVIQYNGFMRGVLLADVTISHHYQHDLENKNFYMRNAFHVFNYKSMIALPKSEECEYIFT